MPLDDTKIKQQSPPVQVPSLNKTLKPALAARYVVVL